MKINEIFYSLQGEGFYAGTPAVFIRFSGCNLVCPFCDTAHNSGVFLSEDEIVNRISELIPQRQNLPLIVLTGGEPSLFVTPAFVSRLRAEFGAKIAMESNGTRKAVNVDFLTVSPKEPFVGASGRLAIEKCNEIKIVFDGNQDPEAIVENHGNPIAVSDGYFLQPMDTGDDEKNKEIIAATVKYCKQHPKWRLSLQTHKILNVR